MAPPRAPDRRLNRRRAAIEAFERRLGHVFADRALLDRALTHASASQGARKLPDNERLEFLGDRVLGLIMAHALVSREACARAARDLGLGEALRLQGSETRRGARDHETILADACEAVIAALYLEVGLEAAAPILLTLWAPQLEALVDPAAADPKSALQERAAAEGRPPPTYSLIARAGPDHEPRFTVEVRVEGDAAAVGVGGSLQTAQKAAALNLLKRQRPCP